MEKSQQLIKKEDGTYENGLGQQFVPDTITFPETHKTDGEGNRIMVKESYTKSVLDSLTDDEIDYIKLQGKSYGNEYIKSQGFIIE